MTWVEIVAISGVILGIIGAALGVINLFWGKNIIGRRPKVKVLVTYREPFLHFKLRLAGYTLGRKRISNVEIRAGFNLVRSRGAEDLYVVEAQLKLNKHLHKRFMNYFPPYSPVLHFDVDVSEPKKLERNKPCPFAYSDEFAGDQLGACLLESPDEKRDFDKVTTGMEEEFEIHWKYSNDDTWGYYRHPPKWWHKVVPVRFRKW